MGGARKGERERKLYSEPVSPLGRIFLQEENEFSIDCSITFQNIIDVSVLKSTLSSSLIRICPRLRSSLIVEGEGRYRWQERSSIDIDKHVIIVPEEEGEEKEDEAYLNGYLAALTSLSPLKKQIPPWEVHVLPPRRRSLVLRFHHAIGDCVSLLAVLLACCDVKEEIPISLPKRERISFVCRARRAIMAAKYTIPYVIARCKLAVNRKKNMLWMPEEGLEQLPRKLASLSLSMEDMMAVKNKVDATINDVLVAILSYGVAKYLDLKSSKVSCSSEHSKDADAIGEVMVNLRREGSKELFDLIRKGKEIKWGSKIGSFSLPIHLKRRDNPLDYVREAKAVLDRKKISGEAQYSYKINALVMSLLGLKAMASLNYKFRHNTSFLLSNIMGPVEPVTLGGNLVTKIGVTLGNLPAALDVHMISYNGKAFLQFLVAEEIIPDPELLCGCVEEGLGKMKANI